MHITEKLSRKQADLYGAEPVTIAFLGDSVTQGCFEIYRNGPNSCETYFEPQHAYSARLREMLAILYPNVQVNIINSGISGDNAPNGLRRLERDVLRYHPDLVVVSYGLNDSGRGDAGIADYTAALDGIFAALESAGIESIFLTENMMNTHVSVHTTDPFFVGLAENLASIQNSSREAGGCRPWRPHLRLLRQMEAPCRRRRGRHRAAGQQGQPSHPGNGVSLRRQPAGNHVQLRIAARYRDHP